jgi:hypothetical protein
LIDFDLVFKEQQEERLEVQGKAGTRVFIAIGVLLGEKHLFIYNLESFFWVLFWIYIYYTEPDWKGRVTKFEE